MSRHLVTGERGDEAHGQTSGQRIPAANLESLVVQRLRSFIADPVALIDALPPQKRDAPSQKRAADSATKIVRALDTEQDNASRTILCPLVAHVQVHADRIDIDLSAERLVERLLHSHRHGVDLAGGDLTPPRAEGDLDHAHRNVRLTVSAQLKRTGKEMKFVVEGDGDERIADPSLARLLIRAHVLAKHLAENPGSTLEEIASREKVGGPYAARLIRLNYLAPDIVASILNGKQPADLTANKLMADTRLPLDWRAQRTALGFA